MANPITRNFVSTASGEVHFRSCGSGDAGVPLVALHASPSSSKSLVPLLAEMEPQRRIIAPDTMGNGQSDPHPSAAPDIADYAAAMEHMADAIGLEQLDLYGSHTGAHIAIEWAIAQPDRVRSLILDGIAYLPGDLRAEYLANYAPPIAPDAIGTQFHQAWNFIRDQMVFFPHYRKDADHLRVGGTFDPATLHELTMDVLGSLDTYHLAYEAVFRHDLAERLPLVAQPTMLIVPKDDHLADSTAFAMKTLPNAEAARIVGGFDMSLRAGAIEAFLTKHF